MPKRLYASQQQLRAPKQLSNVCAWARESSSIYYEQHQATFVVQKASQAHKGQGQTLKANKASLLWLIYILYV